MKKRIVSIVLAAVMLLSLLPLSVWAAETETMTATYEKGMVTVTGSGFASGKYLLRVLDMVDSKAITLENVEVTATGSFTILVTTGKLTGVITTDYKVYINTLAGVLVAECAITEQTTEPTPTTEPTTVPTTAPIPTTAPTSMPTTAPTSVPTTAPIPMPTTAPTPIPTKVPTPISTTAPTATLAPSARPTGSIIKPEDAETVIQKVVVGEDSEDPDVEAKTVVVITFDEETVGVVLTGKDLFEHTENSGELQLVKDRYVAEFNANDISAWDVTEETVIQVIFAQSNAEVNPEVVDKLKEADEINETLLSELIYVGIMADDEEIEQSAVMAKVSVDVSDLDLTDEQKANFTGIFYDEETGDYIQIGGEFSEDGSTFTFFSHGTGSHGVIVSDNFIKINLKIGEPEYLANGKMLQNDVAPYISEEDRTMLPVRVIAEILGAEVDWFEETRTVIIIKDDVELYITIGEPLPDGMGTAVIKNSRTFVPVNYVASMLGARVLWDGVNRQVNIYK